MLETNDLVRLAHEFHRLLDKGDIGRHFTVQPKIVLEYNSIRTMHEVDCMIRQAFTPQLMAMTEAEPIRKTDKDTIEYQIMGLILCLRCTERLRHPLGHDVGYAEMRWQGLHPMIMGDEG